MRVLIRRSRFEVEIYLADEPRRTAHPERLGLLLTRLFRGEVWAEDPARAAAQVWSEQIGEHFKNQLLQLDAPCGVANQQTDTELIVNKLSDCSVCATDHGFLLDNGCETWFIGVKIVRRHLGQS